MIESVFAPPDKVVAVVEATGTVRLLLTTEPAVAAASVGAPDGPSRFAAVAPVVAAEVTLDLV